MRQTSQQEVKEVLLLDGTARFRYFVKRVVDSEVAWGLWKDGWALSTDERGDKVFPLWPAPEYAELCALGEWLDYVPEEIPLNSLVDELLPKLANQGVRPGVFLTPAGRGVSPEAADLLSALRLEQDRYE